MKYIARLTLALLFVVAVWMVSGHKASAQSQSQGSNLIVPHVSFEAVDIREAVRQLFRPFKLSYFIAPEVQGVVTVDLRNVTFDIALQNILRQVDGTYRESAGLFEIVKRNPTYTAPEISGGFQGSQSGPRFTEPDLRASAMTTDGRYLYVSVGSDIYKLEKSDLRVVNVRSILFLDKVDIHVALHHLFRSLNASFILSPKVKGEVIIDHKNVTFETALQALLRQVNATYRIEAGVYEIIPRQT